MHLEVRIREAGTTHPAIAARMPSHPERLEVIIVPRAADEFPYLIADLLFDNRDRLRLLAEVKAPDLIAI